MGERFIPGAVLVYLGDKTADKTQD